MRLLLVVFLLALSTVAVAQGNLAAVLEQVDTHAAYIQSFNGEHNGVGVIMNYPITKFANRFELNADFVVLQDNNSVNAGIGLSLSVFKLQDFLNTGVGYTSYTGPMWYIGISK